MGIARTRIRDSRMKMRMLPLTCCPSATLCTPAKLSHLATVAQSRSLAKNYRPAKRKTFLRTAEPLPKSADDLHRAIKRFTNNNRALFGHGAEVLTNVTREFVAAHKGMRTVVWPAKHRGKFVTTLFQIVGCFIPRAYPIASCERKPV